MAIPEAIAAFLQQLTAQSRSPAWLLVDRELKLVACGGALADYGLGSVRPGDAIFPQLEFLHGLLPLDGLPIALPCVQAATTGIADLHLIPDELGDWVLFLDATEEAERRRVLQQKVNDLALLQGREAKMLAQLSAERENSERLLLSLFPKAIADRLKNDPTACIAREYPAVTVLFADIHNFWKVAGALSPARLIELLNDVFSLFDRLADVHGVQKIKTIGDSYMAVAGVPEPRADHAQAIAEMALSMQREITGLASYSAEPSNLRIGIHSGPVVAGVVGIRRQAYDLWGPTVNVASQMETCGIPGAIQVAAATHALLQDQYFLDSRGEFYVKGEGAVATYALWGRRNK
jgi:adenylate cyclase